MGFIYSKKDIESCINCEQEAIEKMMSNTEQQFDDEYVEEYDHIGDQILYNNDIDNNLKDGFEW